ncbi:MAG: hypothetical protein JST54_12395 [Deltaproteobacteria bacterium]|nr:hypothetical protein [Deltaproteobacteria bacterium]
MDAVATPTPAVPNVPVTQQPVGTNPFTARYWVGQMDLRGIALFRIGLGLFLIFDLLDFAPDLRAWFSNEGVLPLSPFLGQWARSTRFVLMDAFSTPLLVWVYWAIALAVSIAVVLGYRTRLASVLAFVLFAGFQERLPPLFDGSDTVLRLMLFWHMLTASGNVWSLDALRAEKAGRPLSRTGMALPVRMTGVQIGWIYFCSVFWKMGGWKWHDGTAVHYGLHLSHVFARPWAAALADVLPVVQFITYFTLVLEASFLFLTHFPYKPRLFKAIALLAGVALHGGIFLTINVGHFSFLMPLCYVAMFEGDWAQWVVDHASRLLKLDSWRARFEAWASTIPAPRETRPGWPRARAWGWTAAGVWYVLVCWYSMPKTVVPAQPHAVETAIQYASMWSSWDMFAPNPLSTDYHLSAPAVFEDGSTTDLLGEGGDQRGFFFTRWWKYMENVTGGGELLPLEWGRYMCREHNQNLKPGQPRLYTFTLYKDNIDIPKIGEPWPAVQRQSVWNHRCFDLPGNKPGPSLPVAMNQAPKRLP